MPPRKRQAKASSASAPAAKAAPTPRRSALAKEHDLTAAQESEIRSAFALFSSPHPDYPDKKDGGAIPRAALRKCLAALGTPAASPAELRELLDAADPEESGWVGLDAVAGIAALKMENVGDEEARAEVEAAFGLFVRPGESKITLATLKKVAKDLKEEVDDQVLRDMIAEANGGRGVAGGVSLSEFEGVMKRAGALR